MKKETCDTTKLLKDLGFKHSKDRHAIINCFLSNRTWTAEQLIQIMPNTHFSTIYRNLERFLEKGIIKKAHVHDGKQYYEWADQKHHDHLACENCDIVECIPCPIPKTKNHVLEITDLCSTCA